MFNLTVPFQIAADIQDGPAPFIADVGIVLDVQVAPSGEVATRTLEPPGTPPATNSPALDEYVTVVNDPVGKVARVQLVPSVLYTAPFVPPGPTATNLPFPKQIAFIPPDAGNVLAVHVDASGLVA